MMALVSFTEIEKITGGNPQVMKELLGIFVKQNGANVQDIEKLFAAQNWNDLKKMAHKLKSSLALVGLPQHRALAEELEHTAGNEIAQTTKLVKELTEATRKVIAEIELKLKEIA